MEFIATDSTGHNELNVGDKVRFRNQRYTIKTIEMPQAPGDAATFTFEEPQHTTSVADEFAVDKCQ